MVFKIKQEYKIHIPRANQTWRCSDLRMRNGVLAHVDRQSGIFKMVNRRKYLSQLTSARTSDVTLQAGNEREQRRSSHFLFSPALQSRSVR